MLAGRIHELSGPLVLEQVSEPVPSGEQVLVELAAASINPVDVNTSAGRHYAGAPQVPYTAGSEGVGRVLAGGGLDEGTLVYAGRTPTGTLAERFLADARECWALPAGADPALAVALGIAGMAGWLPLSHRARLRAGERVLVLGATGSVGRVAVQGARLLGASRIVAAGRDRAALEELRALGADEVVVLGERAELADRLTAAFDGEGPDVVVDPLWGEPALAALDAAAPHARIVQLGQSAGATATVASATIRGKALDLLGHSNRRVPIAERRAAHLAMLEHATAGRLRLHVERLPLARGPEAWEAVRRGSRRKLAVLPA